MTHLIRRAILFALIGLSLSSCYFSGGNNRLTVLQRVDSLMVNHPDSALSLLESIDNTDTLLQGILCIIANAGQRQELHKTYY